MARNKGNLFNVMPIRRELWMVIAKLPPEKPRRRRARQKQGVKKLSDGEVCAIRRRWPELVGTVDQRLEALMVVYPKVCKGYMKSIVYYHSRIREVSCDPQAQDYLKRILGKDVNHVAVIERSIEGSGEVVMEKVSA